MNIRRGEYSPIFTEPEANNCFSIITQVIIREKHELSEKSEFCLFASNCHASMNRDAQSSDHMLNRNHMLNRQTAHARWLKQNVSIILINFSAVSMRQGVDFFSE